MATAITPTKVGGATIAAGAAGAPFVPQTSGTKNRFTNTGRERLRVTNGTLSSITLTVEAAISSYRGLPVSHQVITVPAESVRWCGPFSPEAHNQTADGVPEQAVFYVSSATNVECEVIEAVTA